MMSFPFWLLRQADDPRVVLVSYAFGIALALLFWNYKKLLHERATARNHVAEVSRDVVVPDHCVICGRPHAPIDIPLRAQFIQASSFRFRKDPSFKLHYVFHFCGDCARLVRRRRRTGVAVLTFGAILFVFSMIEPLFAIKGLYDWRIALAFMPFGILLGIVVFYTGLWMRLYLAQVRPIDTGAAKVFFRFQNQVFRNHFAQLNGEE